MAQKVLPGGHGRRNLLGGTHQKTRRLGSGLRIYRNKRGSVIAIDCFEVTVDIQQLPSGPIIFHRSVDNINISRTFIHLDAGSRVVDLVQMVGDYSSITADAGNFLIATWLGATSEENDVVISFEEHVSKIGDTV